MSQLKSQGLLIGLIAGMASLLALFWANPAREMVLSIGAICLIFLSLGLEYTAKSRTGAKAVPLAEVAGDIGSFALVFILLDGVMKWALPFLILAILPKLPHLQWPLWQQVLAVTLWIELAAWASHWAHHRYKPLWALHAMHHAPAHLYTLNNFRFHPLNHAINHIAMIAPLLLIGFSSDAILIYSALALPVLIMQHSDVDFDFGALNHVFNTSQLHHWHHSADAAEGTKNLGRALVVFDKLFGTYIGAGANRRPSRIGLFAVSRDFPAASRFWAQLMWPFGRSCCASR